MYLGYGSIHCSRLVFILFITIIYCTGQTFHLNVIFMNCKIFLFNILICTYLYSGHPLRLALLKRASLLKWRQTPSWGWGLQPWLSKFWVRVEIHPLIGQMAMHSFTFDQGWVSQLLFLWKQNPDLVPRLEMSKMFFKHLIYFCQLQFSFWICYKVMAQLHFNCHFLNHCVIWCY